MDVVTMDRNAQKIYTLACDVIYGKLTICEFSLLINKSYRQSQRIINNIKMNGMSALIHGNKKKKPWNKHSDELKIYVIDIYSRYYRNFNIKHFQEMIKAEHQIIVNYETLRRWLKTEGLGKHYRRPKKRSYRIRPRLPKAGMLIQFDGSEHPWLGPNAPIYTLIGGIDDATGEVLHLELYPAEDTFNCLDCIKKIIQNKGIPEAFYFDRAGHFGKPYLEQERTQIGRALKEIDCTVILANSPQAKGRIERLWRTMQDRLIAELEYKNITSIRAANKFILDFMHRYNQNFTVPARFKESAYKKCPSSKYLRNVFCIKEKRRIAPGNVFHFRGDKYVIQTNILLRYKFIKIYSYQDGDLQFEVCGKFFSVIKFEDMEDNILTYDKSA